MRVKVGRIPIALQAQLDLELDLGEKVLWMTQPVPRMFAVRDFGAFLFAIPWTAFAVFWTTMASKGATEIGSVWGWLFPLWGVPFIVVGLGMLSAPYWSLLAARSTVYAVTDRRVIIMRGGRRKQTRFYLPSALSSLERRQRADGSGDVVWAWTDTEDDDSDRRTRSGRPAGFLAVPDAKEAESVVRGLAEAYSRRIRPAAAE